jgi:hypothetical protein
VHGTLLAAVSPSNTPHGYNLTFAFPMLMFIIIAGTLYLRFRRPHRVPGHVALASSRPTGGNAGAAATAPAGTVQTGPGPAADEQAVAGEAGPADEGTEDGE